MDGTLPKEVLSAIEQGRLSAGDIGLYVLLRSRLNGTPVLATPTSELAFSLHMSKRTVIEALKRLHAAGVVVYEPTNTRYIESRVHFIGYEMKPMNHQFQMDTDEHVSTDETDEALTSGNFDSEWALSTESTAESASCNVKGLTSTETKKVKRTPLYPPESPEHRVASMLLQGIRKNLDENRRANLQDWSAHVDKLHRLDGRTFDEMEAVIRWLHETKGDRDAEFWKVNILSTRKLREKFPTLMAKMPAKYKVKRKLEGKKCDECHGNGWVMRGEDEAVVCRKCKGKGVVS